MPALTRDLIFAGGDFSIADFKYFGMAGGADILVMLRQQRPEDIPCGSELGRAHCLITKHKHMVFREVIVDLFF